MRRLMLVCLVIMFSAMAWAQNCDQIVYDGANVLNGREREIEQAAQNLIKEGADVRVRTVPSLVNGNLDFNEKAYEQNCSSWQSPNGLRKNNLVSLMVAPREHKMGLYYGADYHGALDDAYGDIKKDMGARFHSGEWAEGFMVGEKGVVNAVASQKAYVQAKKNEASHPHPATVNNIQATDYSGLWTVLKWLIGISLVGFVIGLIVYLLSKRREERERLETAQSMAVNYKNKAGRRITIINPEKLSSRDKNTFDTLVEQYSNASNMVKGDPSVDGQTLAAYNTQLSFYQNLYNDLVRLETPQHSSMSNIDAKKPEQSKPKQHSKPTERVKEPAPPPAPVSERVIIREQPSSDDGFVEGALLGSLLNRGSEDRGSSRRDEDDEPRRSRSRDDDDSSSSSSFGGGGSSDWGGGDSGGGGSSDF